MKAKKLSVSEKEKRGCVPLEKIEERKLFIAEISGSALQLREVILPGSGFLVPEFDPEVQKHVSKVTSLHSLSSLFRLSLSIP